MEDYITHLRGLVGHEKVIMVACGGIIRDAEGKILLVRRTDEGAQWQFPGGYLEMDETPEEAVQREVLEETGLSVRTVKLLCATTKDVVYQNGDAVRAVILMYECTPPTGDMHPDKKEISTIEYFSIDAFPSNFRHPEILAAIQK